MEKEQKLIRSCEAVLSVLSGIGMFAVLITPFAYIFGFPSVSNRCFVVFFVTIVLAILLAKFTNMLKKKYPTVDQVKEPQPEVPKSKFDQYMERSLKEAEKAKHRQGMN